MSNEIVLTLPAVKKLTIIEDNNTYQVNRSVESFQDFLDGLPAGEHTIRVHPLDYQYISKMLVDKEPNEQT